MVKNLFKKLKLKRELIALEKGYEKLKQTKEYKSLSLEEKNNENAMHHADYVPIWEQLEALETKELLRKSSKLQVPSLKYWEDRKEKYWEKGIYGALYLKSEGKHKLIKAIREEQKDRRENRIWWVPITALITSILSVVATWNSVSISRSSYQEQKQAKVAELRPYLMFDLFRTVLPYNKDTTFIELPYQLQNIGKTSALHIQKEYTSYLIDSSGKEHIVQHYIEPEETTGDLLPSQTSPIHVDNINISGFHLATHQSIKVESKISYQQESGSIRYFSKTILVLIPHQRGEVIELFISMPSQYAGLK